jgi:hypothetical protein
LGSNPLATGGRNGWKADISVAYDVRTALTTGYTGISIHLSGLDIRRQLKVRYNGAARATKTGPTRRPET